VHPEPRKASEAHRGAAKDAQLLITMRCGDKSPCVPDLRRDDWPLRDPKGLAIEEVRLVRDEIRERVRALLTSDFWLDG
jgi:arsenate reductase (thioredoxin)